MLVGMAVNVTAGDTGAGCGAADLRRAITVHLTVRAVTPISAVRP